MRILLILVLVAACSKKKDDAPSPAPASGTAAAPKATDAAPDEQPTPTEAAGAPTKDAGIARLKELLALLEAKDYAKAAGYFVLPEGVPADKIAAELGKLIEQKEISGPGIDKLAAVAKWGKLADVFDADRAARFAEKSKVPVDECYGFAAEGAGANASVGFHWDGKELKLIRLNNVGKL